MCSQREIKNRSRRFYQRYNAFFFKSRYFIVTDLSFQSIPKCLQSKFITNFMYINYAYGFLLLLFSGFKMHFLVERTMEDAYLDS